MKKCDLCKRNEAVTMVIHKECFFSPRLKLLHYLKEASQSKAVGLCKKCFEIHKRNLEQFHIDYETYDISQEKVEF